MTRLLLAGFAVVQVLSAQSSTNVGSVDGLVLNSLTGAPIRKAIVTLTQPVGSIQLSADTDPTGQFQFTGLPAGIYRLSARRAGYLPRLTQITVSLGSAGHATTPAIRLRPQGVITGRVLEEDGEPAPGAMVFIYRQVYRTGKRWQRLNAAATANDAGEYRVSGLTPGTYLLQAHNHRMRANSHYGDPAQTGPRPAFFIPVYHPNSPRQQLATPVPVGVGAEVGGIDIHFVKVVQQPSVHVRGKVTGVPGGAQTTVSVALAAREDGAPGGSSVTAYGPDYAFDLSVPPGDYALHANVNSEGGPEAYGSETLNVTGDVEGIVVALSPAPVVTGRILLAEPGSKVKLERIRVLLLNANSSDGDTVRADEAGRFALPSRLLPGRYALAVPGPLPAGYYALAVKLGGVEIDSGGFDITASAQLDIILSSKAATITASVTDEQGVPVSVGVVTLIPEEPMAQMEKRTVDDRGQVQFTNLRPGKYRLHAWREMEDDLWQDPEFRKPYDGRALQVTVGPSETQGVHLKVIPESAIQ